MLLESVKLSIAVDLYLFQNTYKIYLLFCIIVKEIDGCTHLVIRNGKVVNVFTHLSKIPKNGVVHLKGDKIYSIKEFMKSHKRDHNELKKNRKLVNIGKF